MKGLLVGVAIVLAGCMFSVLLPGCVSTGGVYYEGGDYYEPYGYDYGGWGSTYFVVPFHDRDRHHEGEHHHEEERRSAPAYRSAPATHPIPSIPSRPRSGSSGSRSIPTKR